MFKNLFTLLLLASSLVSQAEAETTTVKKVQKKETITTSAINEDFVLILKESFLAKALAHQRNFEYKDEGGTYLKLSNLKLSLDEGFVKGSVNLDKFRQKSYSSNMALDNLIRRFIEADNVAIVKLKSEIGLSKNHQELILKNTQFTKFDNKYLPDFVEQSFILNELNKRFTSQINGQIVYHFPDDSPVDIYNLQVSPKGIQLKGILK